MVQCEMCCRVRYEVRQRRQEAVVGELREDQPTCEDLQFRIGVAGRGVQASVWEKSD